MTLTPERELELYTLWRKTTLGFHFQEYRVVADREDAMHDGFIAFLRAMRKGDEVRDPRGFAWALARNVWCGKARRRMLERSHVGSSAEPGYMTAASPVRTEDITIDAERHAVMLKVLAGEKNPLYRAVITLNIFEDLPNSTVQKRLGLTPTQFRLAKMRGVRKFKAAARRAFGI